MKPANYLILHFLIIVFILLASSIARAQTNGTWINAASNSTWGTASNWSGSTIASGADATADFSTLDIAAGRTVNLGANWTIGTLVFGDATTPSNNWTLANGTGGPWSLTLSGTTPTINIVNQTTTISAVLAGTQGFTKSGTGTLTLTGANTITGGINLSAGVLNFNTTGLGTNLVDITATATLGWNGVNTLDVSPQLKIEDSVVATLAIGTNNVTLATPIQTGSAGTASITKTGTGTLTFTSVNTYIGTTKISAGRIVLSGGNDRLATASSLNLGQGTGSGVLQLGDATSAVNQTFKSLATSGTGTANAIVGGNASNSVLTVNNTTAVTYAGLLGGVGTNENNLALVKTGTNTLTLSNASNSFTGGVTLNQGTLSFAAGSLASNSINITGASTLQWATGNTTDVTVNGLLVADGVTATLDTNSNNITLSSPIQTGPGGTAVISKSNPGILTITGANTFTGGLNVRNGTVVLAGGNDRLAATSGVTIGNSTNTNVTLQLGDSSGPSNQTLTSLATAGTGTNFIKGGNAAVSTLTINNSTAKTYSGTLGGGGGGVEDNLALVKTGAGALTLSGASNSFIGDVSITGGALIVKNSNTLGAGTKTITVVSTTNTPSLQLDGTAGDIALAAGLSLITSNDNAANPAVLNVAGNNTIAGSISPTSGGFGGGNTRIKVNAGSLTLSGDLSPHASATGPLTVIFDSASGTSGSTTGILSDNGSNTLAVTKATAGTWNLSGANTYTGTTTINSGTLQVNAIAANGTAQPLGTATSALLIGSTTLGTLEYTGSTTATLARGITVNGTGGAIIANSGGATLTLSGIQARGARPLTYSSGSFIVSGRITGTSTTSPLTIDNASVRLTHNNNSYISPTLVQNNSTLIVANTNAASSATGTGSVTIDATSTLTGTGYINAGTDNAIVINGSLIVGDPSVSAAASLHLATTGTGSTILGSSSILRLDIFSGAGLGDNSSIASAADQLSFFGALEIQSGSLLRLGNPNSLTAWADGDVFKLFDWTSLTSRTGDFTLDYSDLNLPSGASLNTSNLYSLGTITVIVPEPSRALLSLGGLAITITRRRRI